MVAVTREGPIRFIGELACKARDGRKTETRRVADLGRLRVEALVDVQSDLPQYRIDEPRTAKAGTIYRARINPHGAVSAVLKEGVLLGLKPGEFRWRSPYGVAGDRLWVQESWRTSAKLDADSPSGIAAKAVEAGYSRPWAPVEYCDGDRRDWDASDWGDPGRLRAAMHMQRWASRTTLEVLDVGLQRLQSITEASALAEGLALPGLIQPGHVVSCFARLWDEINGRRRGCRWEDNPFVFAIRFRRVLVS